MKKVMLLLLLGSLIVLSSCGDNKGQVEEGTYKGVAEKVNTTDKGVTVKTDDGQKLEFTFKDSTQTMTTDQKKMFNKIKTGKNLKIQVRKQGDKLVPVSVKVIKNDDKNDGLKKREMKMDTSDNGSM